MRAEHSGRFEIEVGFVQDGIAELPLLRSTISTRGVIMNGEISYIEMGAGDAGQANGFFAQLFGWTFHPMGDAGQGWFETPSIKAGLHGNDPEPRIDVYFRVSNLTAAIARVKELGGEADDPGPEEPGFGRFCNCRTSQGMRFGLHQP